MKIKEIINLDNEIKKTIKEIIKVINDIDEDNNIVESILYKIETKLEGLVNILNESESISYEQFNLIKDKYYKIININI